MCWLYLGPPVVFMGRALIEHRIQGGGGLSGLAGHWGHVVSADCVALLVYMTAWQAMCETSGSTRGCLRKY